MPATTLTATPPGERDGALLELVDVTVDPPQHQPRLGEVYQLGRHVLAVVDVITGWPTWAGYLAGEALFVPHPGPYVVLSHKAQTHPLVMVQPDPYLAGHMLDAYTAIHGPASARLVRDPDPL